MSVVEQDLKSPDKDVSLAANEGDVIGKQCQFHVMENQK